MNNFYRIALGFASIIEGLILIGTLGMWHPKLTYKLLEHTVKFLAKKAQKKDKQ